MFVIGFVVGCYVGASGWLAWCGPKEYWFVLYLLSTTYTLGVVILIYWCGYS